MTIPENSVISLYAGYMYLTSITGRLKTAH